MFASQNNFRARQMNLRGARDVIRLSFNGNKI